MSRPHPPAGSLVRFHGRVAPPHRGLLVLIQKLGPQGHWRTIRVTRLRVGRGFAFYSVKLRVRRTARFRAVVLPDATHAKSDSHTVRVRVR